MTGNTGGSLKFWALLVGGAVLPFLFDAALSSHAALWLLLWLLALALIPSFQKLSRPLLVLVVMFVFTSLSIQERLSQRLPAALDKSTHVLNGVIVGLPESRQDQIRFIFLTDPGQAGFADRLVRVSWHVRSAPADGLPSLHAGERWRLPLQLRSTRAQVNFVGADAERWAFTQGIAARAYVRSSESQLLQAPSAFDLGFWRETILDRMKSVAGDAPAMRLLIALAVADRRFLLVADRQVLSATGTGHLLAISGLHIGLAAVLGFYIGRALLLLFFRNAQMRLAIAVPWLMAWLAALAYAGLAGFGVSTQRALIMLSVATLVILSRRKVHPAHAWLMAMSWVLILDPFAPLRAGFWFSFIAVGVLLMQFSPRFGTLPGWQKILQAQLAISLIMAPLGMYWFQQASLPGLLANVVAIPVVSFITVPLILLGLITMWTAGPLATYLFTVAGYSAQFLFQFLEQLAKWQPEFMTTGSAPALGVVVLAMLGAAIILMPRGLPGRAAGVLLMLPLLLPAANPVSVNSVQTDMLDVGQGLAVLVGSHDYLMLYDTGPGNGLKGEQGWDTVGSAIQPAIVRRTIAPNLIVTSHADLDHSGGLNSLQLDWPEAEFLASLPQLRAGIQPCLAGQKWAASTLQIEALHPAQGLPYLGNDSSCVISIKATEFSLLLTGDISKAVENRLVLQSVSQHGLMTVAHHGSAGSSSKKFIQALQPKLALLSAEANNRFNFPRAEVLQRFASERTGVLNTADCGGIRLTSEAARAIKVETARQQRDAIWRFKAGDFCP